MKNLAINIALFAILCCTFYIGATRSLTTLAERLPESQMELAAQ